MSANPVKKRTAVARETAGLEPEQRFLVHGVSWSQYEAILAALGDSGSVRLAYLEGVLELSSPSEDHEHIKTLTARLLEAFAEERDIEFNGSGNATYRKKAKARGVEPDECYYVGPKGPFPDLVLEVMISSGGLDRLSLYEGLGVKEVWIWKEGRFQIHHLGSRGYVAVPKSRLLVDLDLDLVHRFLRRADQTAAVKEFSRLIRGS